MEQQIGDLKQGQEQQSSKLETLSKEITVGVQIELSRFREQINQETQTLLKDSEQRVAAQLLSFQRANAETIANIEGTLLHLCAEQTEAALDKHSLTVNNKLSEIQTAQQQNNIDLQKLNENLTVHKEAVHKQVGIIGNEVNKLTITTNELQNKVSSIEQHQHNIHRPTEITVRCEGHGNLQDLSLPTFDAKTNNPTHFVERFTMYWQEFTKRKHNKDVHIAAILETCLQKEAHSWLKINQHKITNLENFTTLFYARFWSPTIQNHLRRRLENTHFNPNKKTTRTEYFLLKVAQAQTFQPPMSEEQIIQMLSTHFEENIATAVRMLGINSINTFEELLLRFDQADLERNVQTPQKQVMSAGIETTVYPNRNEYTRSNAGHSDNSGARIFKMADTHRTSPPQRTSYATHTAAADTATPVDRCRNNPGMPFNTRSPMQRPHDRKPYTQGPRYQQEVNTMEYRRRRDYTQGSPQQYHQIQNQNAEATNTYPTKEQRRLTHELAQNRANVQDNNVCKPTENMPLN